MNNQKTSGGNQMSATTRLSLLAGSSIIAAAASIGVALTPTAAVAQASCTSGTAVNGTGTNTVTIAGGNPNNPGVTCAYTGTTAAVSTLGSTTVSTVAPGGGINLTATGSNAINWTSTAGTVTGGVQTNGPVIEALSSGGAINITTAGVTGSNATITHGIRAVSTAGGAITVVSGSVSATSATGDGVTAGGTAAIEAISTGGAVSVNYDAAVSGRLYGIRASTTGDADLTINALGLNTGGRTARANNTAGLAGIYATSGTGLLTITGITSPPQVFAGIPNPINADQKGAVGVGGTGTGVLIDAGGDVVFTGGGTGGQYGIRLMDVAANTTSTLNITDVLSGGVAAIRAEGAGEVIVNMMFRGTSVLNYDFTGLAAPVTVKFMGEDSNPNTGGYWYVPSNYIVPDGNFDVVIGYRGGIIASQELTGSGNEQLLEDPVVVSFAAGAARLAIEEGGIVIVGPQGNSSRGVDRHEAELRFVGLEQFRHAGRIMLGTRIESNNEGQRFYDGGAGLYWYGGTDRWHDDILSLPGATWIGEGGEIVFDIDIGRSQSNCERDPVTGDLGAADCVMIQGGATEGVTYVTLLDRIPGDRGRLNSDGIVLVDVGGGTSAQGHFVVGPNTPGYSPLFGGSLDKGAFHYVLAYNEDTQQHALYGIVSGNLRQMSRMGTAAQSLWRVSTGSWLERQADLRQNLVDGISGGVWIRASGEIADRDVIDVSTAAGQDFAFDNTYEQQSYAVTGGLDLMNGSEGDSAYVVGLMAGYANTKLSYGASPNLQQMDGFTGGAYASFINGGLFVDAAVNANKLVMDNYTPGFGFLPDTAILSSNLLTIGGQVEAGWRFPFAGGLFAEPLASLVYIRTTFDDFAIEAADAARRGLEVSYDDPASLRAALGGRVGFDGDLGLVHIQLSLLGKVWNEMEAKNAVILRNTAFPTDPDLVLTDDFSGQFTELGLGASVWSPGGLVSGFINVGGKFGDDYEAKTASIGVRVAW